jgi:hypothetical protein
MARSRQSKSKAKSSNAMDALTEQLSQLHEDIQALQRMYHVALFPQLDLLAIVQANNGPAVKSTSTRRSTVN